MTTSINIDSLKSSLIEKTEKYDALTLVLAKKETENRLLPSSIARKNTVCEDLVKIISEETSEYEKLYSSINEKIAKRNFLVQQMTEQESIDPPHSIQVLINQLDIEILTDKIYCDALHQSILVQTSTYDALIESATLESTEYDNLDPVISLLKDKTKLLALELSYETEEYEALSDETNVLHNEKNTTVTVDQSLDTYSINTTEHNNEQDFQDNPVPPKSSSDEEFNPQIASYLDKNSDSVFVDSAEVAISTISAEQTTEHDSTNNEPGEYENNIDEVNNDNSEFDTNDINLDRYSLDPAELTNKLYASTIASPGSDQNEAVLNDNQTTELIPDKGDNVTVDNEQFDFSIDVIKLKNEQDSSASEPSEIERSEDEIKVDHQNFENEPEQLKSISNDELPTDIDVDTNISSDSVTKQYDIETDPTELTNEQDSTASEPSEIERPDDEIKIDPQNFEGELEQLKNFSDDDLSTDINVVMDNSHDSDTVDTVDTVDTEQHELEIDQVELKNEQVFTSETEMPEDIYKLNQHEFQNELEQIKNYNHDELWSEIVEDKDSKTIATIDTDQDVFSIDSTEPVNELESSDLKAALASAELDAIENKYSSRPNFEEELSLNNRTTTRYVRSDIKTKLIVYKLLGASKPFNVELLDISSKGALIKSSKKLRKNARVTLKFNFQLDARRFVIAGKIVRKTSESNYGIKFSKYQDEFADHLLNTQTHLVFK